MADIVKQVVDSKTATTRLFGSDPLTKGMGANRSAIYPVTPKWHADGILIWLAKAVAAVAKDRTPAIELACRATWKWFELAYNVDNPDPQALKNIAKDCGEQWFRDAVTALGNMQVWSTVLYQNSTHGLALTSSSSTLFWDNAVKVAIALNSTTVSVKTAEKLEALKEGAKKGAEDLGQFTGAAAQTGGELVSKFFAGLFSTTGILGLALIGFILVKVG